VYFVVSGSKGSHDKRFTGACRGQFPHPKQNNIGVPTSRLHRTAGAGRFDE
jgi:hypothetical protein